MISCAFFAREEGWTVEEQKIAEIRRFSLEMLDILDWYYQGINARNARAYEEYLQKRRKSASVCVLPELVICALYTSVTPLWS